MVSRSRLMVICRIRSYVSDLSDRRALPNRTSLCIWAALLRDDRLGGPDITLVKSRSALYQFFELVGVRGPLHSHLDRDLPLMYQRCKGLVEGLHSVFVLA